MLRVLHILTEFRKNSYLFFQLFATEVRKNSVRILDPQLPAKIARVAYNYGLGYG